MDVAGDEPVAARSGIRDLLQRYGGKPKAWQPEDGRLIRVVEQCAGGCLANGNIPGLTYRSQNWRRT